ncbi:UNVERIFIED_ORG: hypothetical protein GGD60_005180 [Rhizobium esperanzae]
MKSVVAGLLETKNKNLKRAAARPMLNLPGKVSTHSVRSHGLAMGDVNPIGIRTDR